MENTNKTTQDNTDYKQTAIFLGGMVVGLVAALVLSKASQRS